MRPIANKWLLVILAFSLINSYQLLFAEDSIGPCYWQGTECMTWQDAQNGGLETANSNKGGDPIGWSCTNTNASTTSVSWQISGPSELISAGFGGSQSGTTSFSYSMNSAVPAPPEISGTPVNYHQAFIAYLACTQQEYEKWRYYYMPEYELEYIISSATCLGIAEISSGKFQANSMQTYKFSKSGYPCGGNDYQRPNPYVHWASTDFVEPNVDVNVEDLGSIDDYNSNPRNWN